MASAQSPPQLTEYEIHDVLRNERRTWVLEYLQREQEAVTVRELSEQIAALETDKTPPPRNIRDSVYNALHQTHLPKLDDMGIVEYERNRKLVALDDGSNQVNLYMETVSDDDVVWAIYYPTVGMLALVIIAFSSVDIPVFAALSVTGWSIMFFVLFVLSALYQLWVHKWAYLDPLHSSK